MLIVGEDAAGLGVHPIGQHRDTVIFEQLRDVPHVAGGYLHKGIVDGGVFLDGGFELHHHHGQAVHIHDGIRAAGGLGAFDGHLVDDLHDVLVIRLVKINQPQMKVLCAAILPHKSFALHHAQKHGLVGAVHRQSGSIAQGADDGGDFGCRDSLSRILRSQERGQILFDQHVRQLPVQIIAGGVCIALGDEFVDDSLLQDCFRKKRWHTSPPLVQSGVYSLILFI